MEHSFQNSSQLSMEGYHRLSKEKIQQNLLIYEKLRIQFEKVRENLFLPTFLFQAYKIIIEQWFGKKNESS